MGSSATRKSITLIGEPAGAVYSALVEFARQKCDGVQVVVRPPLGLNETAQSVLNELDPELLERREVGAWPGTVLVGSSATVCKYRLTVAVANILIRAADRLYAWQQPGLPEDLCFLREADPWLVTIAHERDSYFELTDGELGELRQRIPELSVSLEHRS